MFGLLYVAGVCGRVRVRAVCVPVEWLEHHGRLSGRHLASRHRRLNVRVAQSAHLRHPTSLPTAANAAASTV